MTINNASEYLKNIWDWAILSGCFGDTKIMPTDIDGHVERNGHFLWLETKAPGVELKQGQEITLQKLAKRGDAVVIIWGEKDNPQKIKLLFNGEERIYLNANIKTLREIVSNWFNWADNGHK